jgi:hypothetical protein
MLPSVKESPVAQSTPKSATISPALATDTSSISSECMRTSRGTLIFLPLLMCTTTSPFLITPWYTCPVSTGVRSVRKGGGGGTWYTRRYVSCPNGLSCSLNASATSGCEQDGTISFSSSPLLMSSA